MGKYRLGNDLCRVENEVMEESEIFLEDSMKRTNRTGVSEGKNGRMEGSVPYESPSEAEDPTV